MRQTGNEGRRSPRTTSRSEVARLRSGRIALTALLLAWAGILSGMAVGAGVAGETGRADAESSGASVPEARSKATAAGYVCPPCGHENDDRVYDRAGACPVCGMRLMRNDERRNVAILLFDGVQIIDYTGPYEVFGQVSQFNVYTVSETGKTLSTAMEMSVNPAYSFENVPDPDILVVPGGNAQAAFDNPKVVAWVREKAEGAEHVLSVCNGAFILAKAGLLDGKKATTFYGLIDSLRAFAPTTEIVTDQRFVDNGKVITSAGLSSGIDASLHLVSKIRGEAAARALALHLEYQWDPHSTFARAALADMKLPAIRPPEGADVKVVETEGDRDRWRRTYEVAGSGMSLTDLRAYVAEKIAALEGWSRSAPDGPVPGGALEWIFTDGDGSRWSGSTRVEPGAGDGTYLVTMTIERAAADRAVPAQG